MKLVIVESPTKASTIKRYLGNDYKVLASFGHIRDLPSKDGSVNPDDNFSMSWELSSGGKKRLNDIITAVKDCDTIVFRLSHAMLDCSLNGVYDIGVKLVH